MPALESEMVPLGTLAPDFSLPNVMTGEHYSLNDVKLDYGVVVMFICAHCPFVKNIEEEIAIVARQYTKQKIGFVAISSNDVNTYPDDAPDKLKEQAMTNDFDFPYLYDETQQVAKAYKAVCTPDFFLFDEALKLIYRGRFDSSTPGNNHPVSGDDLIMALERHLEDEPQIKNQLPSIGCSIKWKDS
ncbi:MAG: thioredoxin family protein [Bacteroidota bacterium]